jgi:hypothetical protein
MPISITPDFIAEQPARRQTKDAGKTFVQLKNEIACRFPT